VKSSIGRLVSVLAIMTLSVAGANAALVQFGNRATFEAQGTIAENYGFEDWGPTGAFSFPPDPYIAHGVTYHTSDNLVVKPDSGYGPSTNVFINNFWTPLPADISGTYDMLGFDLGILGTNSLIDFVLTTNLGVYNFNDIAVPNVNTGGMTFFGFVASAGESFTDMDFTSQLGAGHAPALDNVTLGEVNASAVPEPASLLLLSLGLAGLAFSRRRREPA